MFTTLTTLLTIVIVFYSLKLLLRWLGPYMMKILLRKVEKRFQDISQQEPFQREKTVKRPNIKHPKSKETVGEYVDFEEID